MTGGCHLVFPPSGMDFPDSLCYFVLSIGCVVLYCIVMYCIVLYCIALYCIVLAATVWTARHYDNMCYSLSSLTLPYLPYGIDVLLPSTEASNGPNAHPELTIRLQNPQVQYSPGSIPTRGTIPLLRAYSLGPTTH